MREMGPSFVTVAAQGFYLSLIHISRELRELGIPVIFEEQNINSIYPESEFLIAIHGAFAQSESESTSSRVRWGQRQSMKSGRVTMQYKWMLGYEKGPDGRPVINEEEAETVRFIYQRYLAGDTLRRHSAAGRGYFFAAVGKAYYECSAFI